MYLLDDDGLAQPRPWSENWPFPPIWAGGRSPTEDELIDDEIKRGTSVNDLTKQSLLE